jgi:hypothetical protein
MMLFLDRCTNFITEVSMSKSLSLIAVFSLTAGLNLTGCGGGSPATPVVVPEPVKARIGGTVAGLPSGLTILLVNNGTNIINVDANTTFSFDKLLDANAAYNVTLYSQPSGAQCAIGKGSGTVNQKADNVTDVTVTCEPAFVSLSRYQVGVTITGLTPGSTMTFMNNGGDALAVSGNGLSVFAPAYIVASAPYGPNFNVTFSANPPGQTCSMANANGNVTQLHTNFANVLVTCK